MAESELPKLARRLARDTPKVLAEPHASEMVSLWLELADIVEQLTPIVGPPELTLAEKGAMMRAGTYDAWKASHSD